MVEKSPLKGPLCGSLCRFHLAQGDCHLALFLGGGLAPWMCTFAFKSGPQRQDTPRFPRKVSPTESAST